MSDAPARFVHIADRLEVLPAVSEGFPSLVFRFFAADGCAEVVLLPSGLPVGRRVLDAEMQARSLDGVEP